MNYQPALSSLSQLLYRASQLKHQTKNSAEYQTVQQTSLPLDPNSSLKLPQQIQYSARQQIQKLQQRMSILANDTNDSNYDNNDYPDRTMNVSPESKDADETLRVASPTDTRFLEQNDEKLEQISLLNTTKNMTQIYSSQRFVPTVKTLQQNNDSWMNNDSRYDSTFESAFKLIVAKMFIFVGECKKHNCICPDNLKLNNTWITSHKSSQPNKKESQQSVPQHNKNRETVDEVTPLSAGSAQRVVAASAQRVVAASDGMSDVPSDGTSNNNNYVNKNENSTSKYIASIVSIITDSNQEQYIIESKDRQKSIEIYLREIGVLLGNCILGIVVMLSSFFANYYEENYIVTAAQNICSRMENIMTWQQESSSQINANTTIKKCFLCICDNFTSNRTISYSDGIEFTIASFTSNLIHNIISHEINNTKNLQDLTNSDIATHIMKNIYETVRNQTYGAEIIGQKNDGYETKKRMVRLKNARIQRKIRVTIDAERFISYYVAKLRYVCDKIGKCDNIIKNFHYSILIIDIRENSVFAEYSNEIIKIMKTNVEMALAKKVRDELLFLQMNSSNGEQKDVSTTIVTAESVVIDTCTNYGTIIGKVITWILMYVRPLIASRIFSQPGKSRSARKKHSYDVNHMCSLGEKIIHAIKKISSIIHCNPHFSVETETELIDLICNNNVASDKLFAKSVNMLIHIVAWNVAIMITDISVTPFMNLFDTCVLSTINGAIKESVKTTIRRIKSHEIVGIDNKIVGIDNEIVGIRNTKLNQIKNSISNNKSNVLSVALQAAPISNWAKSAESGVTSSADSKLNYEDYNDRGNSDNSECDDKFNKGSGNDGYPGDFIDNFEESLPNIDDRLETIISDNIIRCILCIFPNINTMNLPSLHDTIFNEKMTHTNVCDKSAKKMKIKNSVPKILSNRPLSNRPLEKIQNDKQESLPNKRISSAKSRRLRKRVLDKKNVT